MKVEENKMRVVVRVRPFSNRELEQNQHNIVKVEDKQTLIFDPDPDEDEFFFHGIKQTHRDVTKRTKKKMLMEFDNVFDWESTNKEIYEACMKPLITSLMDGYNCSVFVYGATGAGKTFTMLGNDECPGLTYLTMRELFQQITDLSAERKFDTGITYLEVYNEQVMNLLTKSGPLKLREDAQGVVVCGLSLKAIDNADDLLQLLAQGNRNRTQHPTDANAESSRSHAIFQVHIRMTDRRIGQKKTVKLSMIDLAGSERAASTKCTGLRFQEGASINKSLLALGNCINKLADGMKHIPYRDSNLTRILKDSLGGNCQTVMIANISSSSLTFEDTYKTLTYASRAKKIRTAIRQNILRSNLPKEYYVKKVSDLQTENERLNAIIQELQMKFGGKKRSIDSIVVAAASTSTQITGEKSIISEQSSASTSTSTTIATESNSLTAAFGKLTYWYKKIDDVYLSVSKAVGDTYKLQSKINVLNFRKILKENVDSIQLQLEGDLNNDNQKRENTIDRFSKQLTQNKENMIRYVKRMKAVNIELEKLKKNIDDCGLTAYLKPYLIGKDNEIESIRHEIKALHALSINSLYFNEELHLRKIIQSSNDIIQHDYMLLKANDLIDSSMQQNYNGLKKLLHGHVNDVKFADDTKNTIQMRNTNETFNLNVDTEPSLANSNTNNITTTAVLDNQNPRITFNIPSPFKRPLGSLIQENNIAEIDVDYCSGDGDDDDDDKDNDNIPLKNNNNNNVNKRKIQKLNHNINDNIFLQPKPVNTKFMLSPSKAAASTVVGIAGGAVPQKENNSTTSTFRPRNLLQNLNETQVLANSGLLNIPEIIQSTESTKVFNNVLGNNNINNRGKALLKVSSSKPKNIMNGGILNKPINKENKHRVVTPIHKRSPIKRNSPRIVKAINSAAQLLSRQRIKSASAALEAQQATLKKFNNITKKY